MSEELKKNNGNIDEGDNYEADQNLLGFFKLLLEVDMRVNPHLYKKKNNEDLKRETEK